MEPQDCCEETAGAAEARLPNKVAMASLENIAGKD